MRPTVHLLDSSHPFDGVAVEMPVNGKRAQAPLREQEIRARPRHPNWAVRQALLVQLGAVDMEAVPRGMDCEEHVRCSVDRECLAVRTRRGRPGALPSLDACSWSP